MKKLIIGMSAIFLMSCKENKKVESTETTTDPEINTTEQPAPAPTEEVSTTTTAQTPLSSKTINGTLVTVDKAKVIGKVLYVELKVKNMGESSSLNVIDVADINYVDDAEAKKHDILKDDDGNYQASPLQMKTGGRLQVSTSSRRPEALISLKFAAPPETSKTITLSIPDFGTFDAIPVSR